MLYLFSFVENLVHPCIAPITPLFNHRAVHLASLYPHFSILKFQLIVYSDCVLPPLYLNSKHREAWMVKPLSAGCTKHVVTCYLLIIYNSKKMNLHLDQIIFVWSYHQLIKLHRASLPQMLTIKMFTLPCLSSASLCHFLICSRI